MSIDWTKPIETIAGYPARVLSTDHRSCGETLVAIQIEYQSFSSNAWYRQNGEAALGSPKIRNRKVKREGWVNVYPSLRKDHTRMIASVHPSVYASEESAKYAATGDVIATVKIEWEEP